MWFHSFFVSGAAVDTVVCTSLSVLGIASAVRTYQRWPRKQTSRMSNASLWQRTLMLRSSIRWHCTLPGNTSRKSGDVRPEHLEREIMSKFGEITWHPSNCYSSPSLSLSVSQEKKSLQLGRGGGAHSQFTLKFWLVLKLSRFSRVRGNGEWICQYNVVNHDLSYEMVTSHT